MDLLDRDEELGRLMRLSAHRDGGLAILWGRRRVGKTRLLIEWVSRAGGTYFVADESAPAIQRRRFAEALAPHFEGFADAEYPDWSRLLSRLAREAQQSRLRGPIVIDELPYLVLSSPELPTILQRFIDHEAKAARLVVALAGSSQRMMQGLALGADSPLYGRAREAFELLPLPPGFLREALGIRDARRVVEAWSVWGGLPRYWELASDYGELRDAIDALVLHPSGVLHDEPWHLLLEELPPATTLRPILEAIGSGAHKITAIARRIGVPVTSLGRAMIRLIELGMVVRETPFDEPERSTKRALYRLADPFLRLWFQVVAPRRALLAHAPRATRLALFDARAPHLAAAAWEELCRAAVPRLGSALGAELGPARRFWAGSGPEWDLAAATSDRRLTIVGKVKWSPERASASVLQSAYADLVRKGAPPFAAGQVRYALFVPSLPTRRPATLPREVRLVDAKMVIEALSEPR